MSKRIEGLIKQCTYTTTTYANGIDESVEEFDKERFAELIIKECTAQIDVAIPDTDCSSSGAYKTAKIAATSRIKQHFGIKE